MTFPFPFASASVAASGSVGGHRYWGVRITASQDAGSTYAIARIEMAETHFGANLATDSLKASATSSLPGYGAGNAMRDALYDSAGVGTAWATSSGGTQIWWYDFGTDKDIKRVTLWGRGDTWYGQNPKDFEIVYSDDGSSWTAAKTVTGAALNAPYSMLHNLIGTPATYSGTPWGTHLNWRLNIIDDNGSGTVAIGELQFMDTPTGSDQATGGTASASSVYSSPTYVADKAFDDDVNSLWSAATSTVQAWIQYAKASAYSVGQLRVRSRSDGFPATSPRRFVFQFSDDGVNYTSIMRPADQVLWGNSEERSFTDPYFV